MTNASAPAAFTVALLLAAMGLKLPDLVKYVVSIFRDQGDAKRDSVNGVVTLILTAVLGILVVQFLLKPSAWGDEITIGRETLSSLGFGSTIVFGVVFSTLAGTLYDFKKAVDDQDSAKKPKLVDTQQTVAPD